MTCRRGPALSLLTAFASLFPYLGLLPRASAQDGPEAPDAAPTRQVPREAIELFQRARDHYQHGRYEEASRDLERALVLDPGSPTLLYNLGRVYELSGEHDRAIDVYQRYLRVLPASDEAERERTRAAIRRLQGAREYRRADEDVYSQPIRISQRGVADDAFWATLLAGGGAVILAGALGVAAVLLRDEATTFVIGRDGEFVDREARFATARDVALATDVLGAIGVAAVFGAGLLWVLRERTVELYPGGQGTIALLVPMPAGAGLVVGGSL